MKPILRKYRKPLIILVALTLAISGFYVYQIWTPFNSEGWQANDLSVRRRMANDLIWRKTLIGLTRPQVDALLGDNYLLTYEFGNINEFGASCVLFSVNYNPQGRVISSKVRIGD